MSHNSLVVLKTLCELSNWSISNLQSHKLLYLSHMLLVGGEGIPLVEENFEAWDYGPVLPSVYHSAKAFGNKSIRNIYKSHNALNDENSPREMYVIRDLVEFNKKKKPFELVSITHWEGGAWAKNYTPGMRGNIIPNADILEEYKVRAKG